MSISGALNAALSGLGASARSAAVVSDNVANASTPGYGPRRIELAARATGQVGAGVQVSGITRDHDPRLTGDRRLAEATSAEARAAASGWSRIEALIGLPGSGDSLADRVAALDAALIRAESRPDLSPRLADVLGTAAALAEGLSRATAGVQALRAEADATIAAEVEELNDGLQRIEALNRQILRQRTGGDVPLALVDQRQQAIDAVSSIVPLIEVMRPDGQVALYTRGGAALLEARAAVVGFAPSPIITPEMAPGAPLSGLTLNGRPIPSAPGNPMDGGSLGAAFAARDQWGPAAQAGLDLLARDLALRFESPVADPTLLPGQPGLFTDMGAPVDPIAITGLAGRLDINALADPAQGGELWRLRDGLGATASGDEGRADGLAALRAALLAPIPGAPGDPAWAAPQRDIAGRTADLLGTLAGHRIAAEGSAGFAGAREAALREAEAVAGVDTDAELQRLLTIEQAFAANARVVQVASDMLRRLMEI